MARKKYQGVIYDKERSKQKLIQAVGTVIKEKGYTGLTATNISKAAGLSRKLISLYFTSTDQLIEMYIKSKDYWIVAVGSVPQKVNTNRGEIFRQLLEIILLNQLDYLYSDEELRNVNLWLISERSAIMEHVNQEREKLFSVLLGLADNDLKNKKVDLRAAVSLLAGGIYFMVHYSKTNDSPFYGIDINQPEGMERIKDAIRYVLDEIFHS